MKNIKIVLHTENADMEYIHKVSNQFYSLAAQSVLNKSELPLEDKYKLLSDLSKDLKC